MMNAKLWTALAIAAAAAGCAAPAGNDEASVQASAEALTLQQCATQRDTCLTQNPFFGFFTCPIQIYAVRGDGEQRHPRTGDLRDQRHGRLCANPGHVPA
jgi:hypothetical protein